jgi:hypothetical protein
MVYEVKIRGNETERYIIVNKFKNLSEAWELVQWALAAPSYVPISTYIDVLDEGFHILWLVDGKKYELRRIRLIIPGLYDDVYLNKTYVVQDIESVSKMLVEGLHKYLVDFRLNCSVDKKGAKKSIDELMRRYNGI